MPEATPPPAADRATQTRLDRLFAVLDYAEALPRRNPDGSLAAQPPAEVAS